MQSGDTVGRTSAALHEGAQRGDQFHLFGGLGAAVEEGVGTHDVGERLRAAEVLLLA